MRGRRRKLWILPCPSFPGTSQGPVACLAVAGAALALALPGCALWKDAVDDPPGPEAGNWTDPAGQEGRHEFDSDLCWQSVGGESAEGVEDQYRECMRQKGWSEPR